MVNGHVYRDGKYVNINIVRVSLSVGVFRLIIILINFYGTYILRNLSSEAQQNRLIKHTFYSLLML